MSQLNGGSGHRGLRLDTGQKAAGRMIKEPQLKGEGHQVGRCRGHRQLEEWRTARQTGVGNTIQEWVQLSKHWHRRRRRAQPSWRVWGGQCGTRSHRRWALTAGGSKAQQRGGTCAVQMGDMALTGASHLCAERRAAPGSVRAPSRHMARHVRRAGALLAGAASPWRATRGRCPDRAAGALHYSQSTSETVGGMGLHVGLRGGPPCQPRRITSRGLRCLGPLVPSSLNVLTSSPPPGEIVAKRKQARLGPATGQAEPVSEMLQGRMHQHYRTNEVRPGPELRGTNSLKSAPLGQHLSGSSALL
ncbi:hypothetical protein NDU88_004487 [Pleurodeles waltl]|uniref:Uncharacterized protein n=1 Tax=Pleurodeles waltl TaxID=8319 RepID=A0AAV7KXV7_PLEWA|nr:hypothetical protein NDU88_004487 [Pleurodeles waltl]